MSEEHIELRPIVRAFAEEMERKLRANDHRGGWNADDYEYIWDELHRHLGKLTRHISSHEAKILPDAADVANLAMILCDILGVLRLADVPCPKCDGTGLFPGVEDCPRCHGRGYVTAPRTPPPRADATEARDVPD